MTSSGRVVGIVALARPADAVERSEQTRLWLGLAAAGAAALVGAVLLALALARWVDRPLRRLETAAVRLGEGSLSARASTSDGPAEIRQLAATFNQMAGRLESLLASQRNVLADVSHQLRTPLAALRLRLELMRQDAAEGQLNDLDGTLEEVTRLSHLVDGLLAVARAENAAPTPEVIDAAAVTDGPRRGVDASRRRGGADPVRSTAVPAAVLATAGHLEQVLDNLLANAIEATPEGGRITVTMSRITRGRCGWSSPTPAPACRRPPGSKRYGASGARIAPAASHPATVSSSGHGTGLGLAIADRLLTVDQGSLTLDGGPEGGLVAIVELPLARERHPGRASP